MKELNAIFYQKLKPLGFSKKNSTFFYLSETHTLVFDIQASSWSKLYYNNIGLWFYDIGGKNEKPKTYQCHMHFRPSDYYLGRDEEAATQCDEMLNFEKEDVEKKLLAISKPIDLYIIPLLHNLMDIHNIVKLYKSGFRMALFLKDVESFLQNY